jgi:hypothetical protein
MSGCTAIAPHLSLQMPLTSITIVYAEAIVTGVSVNFTRQTVRGQAIYTDSSYIVCAASSYILYLNAFSSDNDCCFFSFDTVYCSGNCGCITSRIKQSRFGGMAAGDLVMVMRELSYGSTEKVCCDIFIALRQCNFLKRFTQNGYYFRPALFYRTQLLSWIVRIHVCILAPGRTAFALDWS